MLSARQLLLMRRTCDRAIGIAIAPTGAVALLPDPDFRRRVFGCVSHVGLAFIARKVGRMDKMASVGCPVIVVGGRRARDSRTSRSLIYPGRADMLCPSVISRFGTLADKQRFDAASAMGQTRSWGHVGSMSGLPESGQGRAIYGR